MLAKQQANAYIEARRLILEGSLSTVSDVIKAFPDLSESAKQTLLTNLLTVLTSSHSVQPVITIK